MATGSRSLAFGDAERVCVGIVGLESERGIRDQWPGVLPGGVPVSDASRASFGAPRRRKTAPKVVGAAETKLYTLRPSSIAREPIGDAPAWAGPVGWCSAGVVCSKRDGKIQPRERGRRHEW